MHSLHSPSVTPFWEGVRGCFLSFNIILQDLVVMNVTFPDAARICNLESKIIKNPRRIEEKDSVDAVETPAKPVAKQSAECLSCIALYWRLWSLLCLFSCWSLLGVHRRVQPVARCLNLLTALGKILEHCPSLHWKAALLNDCGRETLQDKQCHDAMTHLPPNKGFFTTLQVCENFCVLFFWHSDISMNISCLVTVFPCFFVANRSRGDSNLYHSECPLELRKFPKIASPKALLWQAQVWRSVCFRSTDPPGV